MLDFAVIFGIIIFAVERTDTQQYRSGHNEHDWKSCVRQKRTESSNLSCCAKKNTTQQGGVLFCIQRFEQGMSEAKKRPSGAFLERGRVPDGAPEKATTNVAAFLSHHSLRDGLTLRASARVRLAGTGR